ncbi:unnamed protein product [Taenia asiatica]|uniref:Uncharacterized protein n=1 Tax=Taenia asiatica TaxID=60517 RepID=A0A0R3WBJ2_TAEAS|nr:unnamed protein product [Taenia asiatica]
MSGPPWSSVSVCSTNASTNTSAIHCDNNKQLQPLFAETHTSVLPKGGFVVEENAMVTTLSGAECVVPERHLHLVHEWIHLVIITGKPYALVVQYKTERTSCAIVHVHIMFCRLRGAQPLRADWHAFRAFDRGQHDEVCCNSHHVESKLAVFEVKQLHSSHPLSHTEKKKQKCAKLITAVRGFLEIFGLTLDGVLRKSPAHHQHRVVCREH